MSYPAYVETKASGVAWLGDVPHDWEVKRTRYACQLNPKKSEISGLPPDTLVSFLPMEKVGTEGETVLDENRAIEDVLQGFTYFRDEDIIVAKITPCFENGKGALVSQLTGGIGFGSTEFHVLRPERHNAPRFIYYLTKSGIFRALGTASMYGAGGQKRVPEDFIEDLRVAFPPLPEQRQIAAFLDRKTAELDAVLRLKARQLELLAEKRQALISQAVTQGLDPTVPLKASGIDWLGNVPEHWEVKMLKRSSQIKRGASPRPIDDPIYFDENGEYAWVRIADVTASYVYLEETVQRLSLLGTNLSVKLEPGALFLSIAGSVGKACIAKIKCCIHDGFVYFPSLTANAKFLLYIFVAGEAYKGLGKLGTQLNLNTDTVGEIKIGFPPIAEQQSIVAYIDRETARMDGIAQAIRTQIEKVREYRQALISAAVTGKIDVRSIPAEAERA